MIRLERAATAAFLIGMSCGPVRAQVSTDLPNDTLLAQVVLPVQMVLAPHILQGLDSIASSPIERFRCVLGVIRGPYLWADLFYEPRIGYADKDSVSVGGCPVSTVIEWHTHPPEGNTPFTFWCYLSGMDMMRAKQTSVAFYMVHVRRGVYCWWSLSQILRALERNPLLPRLDPIKGQTSWERPKR
jgi:hypothetical protein